MSETSTRSNMDELRIALAQGLSIEDFHRETSRTENVVGYIRATVTATKDDGVTPKSVQFSSHELALPVGQDEKFYPTPIREVLQRIRITTAAIQ